jgi:hypothetical protein
MALRCFPRPYGERFLKLLCLEFEHPDLLDIYLELFFELFPLKAVLVRLHFKQVLLILDL